VAQVSFHGRRSVGRRLGSEYRRLKDGTLNYLFSALRALCRVRGVTWPRWTHLNRQVEKRLIPPRRDHGNDQSSPAFDSTSRPVDH
jgi:hypothetical protein